jgi:dihydroorotate dehydrogenase (fumarate)
MTVDFSTEYLGLKLRCPLMVASCPLASELDVLRRIEELGAGAAVLPSLFEEQIESPAPSESKWYEFQGASAHHFHELMQYNHGPHAYLRHLERAKKEVSLPLLASINAASLGGWVDWSRRIEQAGADGLELNLMILAVDPQTTSSEIEERYVDIVSAVRAAVKLPLAVKLGSYFTALPHFVARLGEAGADGVVLFNRPLQPDINLASGRVVTHLALSTPDELNLRLRWLAILYGRVPTALAATGGVASAMDFLKALAAGADVVQVASVLYRRGVEAIGHLRAEAEQWLANNEFGSLKALRGMFSQLRCTNPAAFARANYTRAISSFVAENA